MGNDDWEIKRRIKSTLRLRTAWIWARDFEERKINNQELKWERDQRLAWINA
jgi:hypothetical protein